MQLVIIKQHAEMNSCYKIDMSITTTVTLPILDDEST